MSVSTKQHLNAVHQVACEQQGELAKLTAERDDLKAKLAQVEATAQRRLELLRKCEWEGDLYHNRCPHCRQSREDAHKPTCPLAQELKEGGK